LKFIKTLKSGVSGKENASFSLFKSLKVTTLAIGTNQRVKEL